MTIQQNNEDDVAAPEKLTPNMKPSQAVSVYRRIGRAALRVNKAADEAWKDWTEVLGPWILERIAKAEQLAGGRTRGTQKQQQLQKQFGKEFYPIYQELSDNGTLSQLRNCLRELDAVNAYRSRLAERPGSPDGMWRSFENSRRSSPKFEDAGVTKMRATFADLEDEEEFEKKRASRTRKNQGLKENDVLEKVNELIYTWESMGTTGDAKDDASAIWSRVLRKYANDERGAAAYCRDVMRELEALVASVLGETGGLPKPD